MPTLLLPLALSVAPVLAPVLTPTHAAPPGIVRGAAQGTRPLPELIPADASVVLLTDSFDAIRARARDNAWARFFGDPSFERAFTSLAELFATDLDESQRELVDVGGILASIHGRTGAFLSFAPGSGEGDEGFTLGVLVEPGTDRSEFAGYLDALYAELDASWPEQVVLEHQGAALRVFDDADGRLVVLDSTDLFGVVFSDEASVARDFDAPLTMARTLLDRRRGADVTPGFVESTSYRAMHGEGEETRAFEVHVDLYATIEATVGWDREEHELPFLLGIDRIRWIQLDGDVGPGERLGTSLRAHVPRDTVVGGFVDLLGPLPTEALARIPAGTTGVGLFHYDFEGAFDLLTSFLREHEPEAHAELVSGLEEASAEAGVDIEADVIRQIDGRIATFDLPIPEAEFRASLPPFVPFEDVDPALLTGTGIVLRVKDATAVRRTVRGLLYEAEVQELVTTEPHGGVDVHTIDFMGVLRWSWAFLPGGVVLSQFPTPVVAAIDARAEGAPTAAGDARYRDVIAELGDASILTITDTRTALESVIAVFDMVEMMFPVFGSSSADGPDAATVAKYFSGTMSFSVHRNGDVFELRFSTR